MSKGKPKVPKVPSHALTENPIVEAEGIVICRNKADSYCSTKLLFGPSIAMPSPACQPAADVRQADAV